MKFWKCDTYRCSRWRKVYRAWRVPADLKGTRRCPVCENPLVEKTADKVFSILFAIWVVFMGSLFGAWLGPAGLALGATVSSLFVGVVLKFGPPITL